jgi:DNA-binding MarR family transcriptional regulator
MLPLGKMSDRLQVHPTSVTNTVDALERSGYVTRRPSERDRRQTLAVLTTAGRTVAEAATLVLNDARFATEPMSRGDLETIAAVLQRLRASADGAAGA